MNKLYFDLQRFADTVVPTNLREKAWAKKTWTAALIESTISKFVGASSENIVQYDDTMKKEAGDQITFKLRMPLIGAGVTGDNILEGNEEAMEYFDFPVPIDQLRHAVRIKGKMEEKRTSTKLRTEAKDGLKDWFSEKIEKMYFDAINANPTARRIVYPDGATSKDTITTAMKMSCSLISKAKRKAKKRITYVGTDTKTHIVPKIRPVMVNGKKYYVFIMTEEQMRDLRNDSTWIAAQSQANVRGEDNPMFSGAEGVWDGCIIFTNDNVAVANNATPVAVGHALLLGAQAACFAVGSDPEWNEDTFDYKDKVGFELGQIFGIAKSVFDGEDLGVIHVYSASVAD